MTILGGHPSARHLAVRALVRSKSPLYVGAVNNRRNLGDDLLFRAHEVLLDTGLSHLPMGGNNRLLRVRSVVHRDLPVVLGGGTLIGRPAYRRALEASFDLGGRRTHLSMLGVGVSSPGTGGKSTQDELERWKNVLCRAPQVRVRGPRSQALLDTVGVQSVITGDPVLALLRPLRKPLPERAGHMRIGVNPADVPSWHPAESTILRLMGQIAQDSADIALVALSAADYDDEVARRFVQVATEHGLPTTVRTLSGSTPSDVSRALADLDLVIGVRLHILVSAAALGVPYIARCYEDKSWDFQGAVGLAGFSQSLPDVDGDWLDERIRDLRGVGLPAEAEAKVDEFVARQQAAAHAALTELRL